MKQIIVLIFLFASACQGPEQSTKKPKEEIVEPKEEIAEPEEAIALVDILKAKENQVYDRVDEMPHLSKCATAENKNGCTRDNFLKYIFDNLRFSELSEADRNKSFFAMSFIIEKNGSISNIQFTKEESLARKSNILNLLKNMPSWEAGKMEGEAKRVKYNLPIRVRLE